MNGVYVRELSPFPNILLVSSQYGHNKKKLIGGILIDDFGGILMRNSVILIEGDKITKIGQVGAIDIPTMQKSFLLKGSLYCPDCGHACPSDLSKMTKKECQKIMFL